MERLKVRRARKHEKDRPDLDLGGCRLDGTIPFHLWWGNGGICTGHLIYRRWLDVHKAGHVHAKKKTVSKGVGRVNPTHKKLMKLQGEAANGRVEAAMSMENKLLGRSCESIKLSGSWYTLPISRTNARDGSIGSRKPWPRCSCNRN